MTDDVPPGRRPRTAVAERRAFSVAIFCRNGGEILLVRHKRLDLWLPVGGEVEPGETPLEAARRELREETGLEGDFPAGLGGRFQEPSQGSCVGVALTPMGVAQRSRRGRFQEPSQGSCVVDGTPPGLIGYEEHPAGSKGLHMNFAFVADVATRELAACDEYTAVRWVGDPVSVACPLNVQQLVRLALAAR